MLSLVIVFFIQFGFLIIALTVHEFAHGWVAYKFGDPTAKYSGRLTLNPSAHIDLFWTILLPLILYISTKGQFVFGSAKPVPVNFQALKNPKRDMILVGLAGPLANFILAFICSLFIKFLPSSGFNYFFTHLLYLNVILGAFNLIPIPPLDGSRVMMGILPHNLAYKYAQLEPYGFSIVILLSFLGILDLMFWPLVRVIFNLFNLNI